MQGSKLLNIATCKCPSQQWNQLAIQHEMLWWCFVQPDQDQSWLQLVVTT